MKIFRTAFLILGRSLKMEQVTWNIIFSVGSALLMLLLKQIVKYVIRKRWRKAQFLEQRKHATIRLMNFIILLVEVIILAGVWGLEGTQIFAFITSALTVLGVAFFAQWSLLSNITAGLILYFNHPLKLGDHISFVEKDYPLKGTVEDIGFFFVYIKDASGEIFTIANTVIVQKTIHVRSSESHEESDKVQYTIITPSSED